MGSEVEHFEKPKFPDNIQGLKLLLAYSSEDRQKYFTEVVIKGNELVNNILTDFPEDFKRKT